jgi:predicted DNA-binding transcriptional regulator YafY
MSSFERIFWLYQRLKQGTPTKRQDYTDKFEVSESTFKRDLAFFRDRIGAPVASKGGRYILTDRAFELPSFWFNRIQLLLLIGICNQLQKLKGITDGNELSVFSDRLKALLTLHDGSDLTESVSFEQVEWAICDCHYLDLVMEAILARRSVLLVYRGAGSDAVTSRMVEPYRLHNYMGSWYLIGFCCFRYEPRVFQLARFITVTLASEDFKAPRFDVDALVGKSFGIFKGADTFEVVLRFDSFIARFIRNEIWHDAQQIEEQSDGSLILILPVSNLTEIKMKVLKYGSHVEVIRPLTLRQQVIDEAVQILRNYGQQ